MISYSINATHREINWFFYGSIIERYENIHDIIEFFIQLEGEIMFKKFTHKNLYFFSFLVPSLLFGLVLVLFKVYPFGNQSTLMGDQYTQYIQFYNHFYDVLKGKGSLLYSWESGMGLNFWGTFSYYLSSPLSIIVLLFERDNLPEAFILMTLLKIGLSGLTMSVYLKSLFNSKTISTIIFSTMYALMSFEIGYFFNIMWLDSLYLLPIVLLGVERLFKKKYFLFIISLAILFISNFYISYMVGIFSFLYFVIRYLSVENGAWRTLMINVFRFILCTLLAAGLSAFVIIPTYLQLKSNSLPSFDWNIGNFFKIDLNFVDLIAKFYNGSTHLFDHPNVYGGVLSLLLFPLFFSNKKIKTIEKILFFLLFLMLVLSFQIKGLNVIWHAFQEPTGYTQRFAFLLTFTILYLAFRVYINFDKDQVSQLFKSALVNIAIIVFLTAIDSELMSMQKAIVNIILLVTFTFLLYAKISSLTNQKLIQMVLLFVVLADVGTNSYLHMRTLYSYPGYNYSRDQYNISTSGFKQIINNITNKDKGFYRVNSLVRLTKNDSIRYGYKSMDNFNTLSNGTLHEFMYRLGYSTTLGPRSLTQNKGILSSDALLGFKYEIKDQPINKHGYVEVANEGATYLYENKNVLPLGFIMNKEQFNLVKEDNPFINQNILLGGQENYFTKLDPIDVNFHNLTVNQSDSIIYVKKNNPDEEGYIEYTFNINGNQQFYTLLSAGKGYAGFGETTIFVNGQSLGVYPNYHYEGVLDLGAYTNEKVKIKIMFSVPETQLAQNYFYTLDIPLFEERINELRKDVFTVTDYKDTSINGNITVRQPNTLFFSIPYDEGWHAKVDGKHVPIVKLGGFLGIDMVQGTHHIELNYKPVGFTVGCFISIICLLILFIFIYFKQRKYGVN